MGETTGVEREAWGSRLGFILAAAGSAVGLGNVWRFPYVAGESGGGAFILVYLVCVGLVGIPVFLGELTIGRHTQRNPVGAFRALREKSYWPLLGGMGVAAGFLILSFYSVIAGWTLGYTLESLIGVTTSFATPEASGAHFAEFAGNPSRALGFHAVFMLITIVIVARGVEAGIERASKLMMPLLLLLLAVVIVRGLTLPGSGAGVEFILSPDLSALTPGVILNALGQAFFTLSLGMGAMITYGSYLSRDHDLVRSSVEVAGMDTLVAVAAGFAIFPALFALGMEPGQGPSLIFVTLPVVFGQMAGGTFVSTIFFFLLALAALTSSISLLEVCSAYFIDEHAWPRRKAAWLLGTTVFLLGVPSGLSVAGPLADWSLASLLGGSAGEGILGNIRILQLDWFNLMDRITANYMLPLGGMLTAIFAGWVWARSESVGEVRAGNPRFAWAPVWINLLRWVCPLVIGQVLVMGILGEFLPASPEQAAHFPAVQALADRLQTLFGWIDIVVAAVVVAFGVWQARARRGSGG